MQTKEPCQTCEALRARFLEFLNNLRTLLADLPTSAEDNDGTPRQPAD
jgi:hypothetical protein